MCCRGLVTVLLLLPISCAGQRGKILHYQYDDGGSSGRNVRARRSAGKAVPARRRSRPMLDTGMACFWTRLIRTRARFSYENSTLRSLFTADLQVTTTALAVDRGYQKIEGSACDEFGTIGGLWGGRHGTQCAFSQSLSRNQVKRLYVQLIAG